jgi:hypothetical protein
LGRHCKIQRNLEKKDKHIDFQSEKWVYIIPRKKSKINCAAKRHFIDRKWGPARIKTKLRIKKTKVLYLRQEKIAKGWEACRVSVVNRPYKKRKQS